VNPPKDANNKSFHRTRETPRSVSHNISTALYYLEDEAKAIGMRRLAAKIHLAAVEAEVLADDLV